MSGSSVVNREPPRSGTKQNVHGSLRRSAALVGHHEGMTDDDERRHLLLTVTLPDRPGALGAVASRIGALGADITDVAVGGRGRGTVHDTFHLDLPSSRLDVVDLVDLLLVELREVDGVVVESWQAAGCCVAVG